jgi:hypothetical protein
MKQSQDKEGGENSDLFFAIKGLRDRADALEVTMSFLPTLSTHATRSDTVVRSKKTSKNKGYKNPEAFTRIDSLIEVVEVNEISVVPCEELYENQVELVSSCCPICKIDCTFTIF